jgi:hypothetical protein
VSSGVANESILGLSIFDPPLFPQAKAREDIMEAQRDLYSFVENAFGPRRSTALVMSCYWRSGYLSDKWLSEHTHSASVLPDQSVMRRDFRL